MEQESKKEKLESLPKSSDKEFWGDAVIETMTPIKPEPCNHLFILMNGIEAECKKCHIGFYLSAGMYVMNGSIYHDGQVVI